MRLGTEFYYKPTLTVAMKLLGKRLMRKLPEGLVGGWIVEVEAYHWKKRRSMPCFARQDEKQSVDVLTAGRLYVYPIHAKFCMNIVTEKEGLDRRCSFERSNLVSAWISWHRAVQYFLHTTLPTDQEKLCLAFDIDRTLDGCDLVSDDRIWIEDSPTETIAFQIASFKSHRNQPGPRKALAFLCQRQPVCQRACERSFPSQA